MISVVMPYWMRQDALDRGLRSLDYWYSDLEVIVVDDGSPVPAVVPSWVKLIRLPQKDRPLNPCVPINVGVAYASHDLVVLTNPEIEHVDPVLDEMRSLCESPLDYVIARCRDADGTELAGLSVNYRTEGRLPVPPNGHFHFCAMLHKWLWREAGGFDPDYRYVQGCDDNDWLWRLDKIYVNFRLTEGWVKHHRSNTAWNLPHGKALFEKKWPCAS